jgi:hypothetical protein
MKHAASILIFALACVPALAQTAKVIPLSQQDAAQRKSLEDQRAEIEQKIKDFDQRVRVQYTTVLEGDKDASNSSAETISFLTIGSGGLITYGCGMTLSNDPAAEAAYEKCQHDLESRRAKNPPPKHKMYRIGWEHGVIYTEDFKYIVPSPAPVDYANRSTPWCGTVLTVNPATQHLEFNAIGH